MIKFLKAFFINLQLANIMASHANQLTELKSKTGMALILLTTILLIALGYLATFTFPYFSKQSSLFNVDARTEFVSISPFEGARYPQWRLDKVHLYDGCDNSQETVNGVLKILPATTIDIERIEKGPLTITLNTPEFEESGVIIRDDGSDKVLSDCAILIFDTVNQSYILPIDGTVTLGHQISENNARPPVLKGGTIYVADKRILADDYYQNTSFTLRVGDRFLIREPQTQASGFVFTNNSGELDISYRVKGKSGMIQKYKSEPILVANSFWSKLVNDDILAIFWFFLLTLFSIIKSLFFLKWNNNSNYPPNLPKSDTQPKQESI